MPKRLPLTSTQRVLDVGGLPPEDFERLCLRLVMAEGYRDAHHYGARGGDNGRDIVAFRAGERFVFQCKRVESFEPKDARTEVGKVVSLPADRRPAELVFIVTCPVTATTRDEASRSAAPMRISILARTDLDARLQAHPAIVRTFFGAQAVAKQTPMWRAAVWSGPVLMALAVALLRVIPAAWNSVAGTRVAVLPLVASMPSAAHPISAELAETRQRLATNLTNKLAGGVESASAVGALPENWAASIGKALIWSVEPCLGPDALEQIRRQTGVAFVLNGSFDTFADEVTPKTLTLCLQRTWDKRTLVRRRWDLSSTSMEAISESLSSELGLSLAALRARFFGRSGRSTNNPDALRLYFHGLEDLQRYNLKSAREGLEAATREDPKFYSGHYGYSRVLQELGQDQEAKVEAGKALQLFEDRHGGDRREHALLQAYSLVTEGKWVPATRLYLTLWHDNSADVEAALLAAETWNLAHRGHDALALIKEIRQRAAAAKAQLPFELDVRLDIEEGIAAERADDTEREKQAAQAALAKLPLNQERLKARAEFLLCDALVSENEKPDGPKGPPWPGGCQDALEKLKGSDRINYGKFVQLKARSLLGSDTECALIKDRNVVNIFKETGFERGVIDQLSNLANTLTNPRLREPQWREAELHCDDALKDARSTESLSLPLVLTTCAYIPAMNHHLTDAAAMYEEALRVSQQREDEYVAAIAAGDLAYVEHGLGRLQSALGRYQYSLELSHKLKDEVPDFGSTLIRYARLLSDMGNEAEARKQYALGKEEVDARELDSLLTSMKDVLPGNPAAWRAIAVRPAVAPAPTKPARRECTED